MKKLFLTTALTIITAVSAFAADMIIQPSELPQNSQAFISKTFKGAQIVAAQKDRDSYEAVLNNGTKISFTLNGEWDEIKAYSALPDGLLPAPVEAAAKTKGQILEIDKDFGYYDVKVTGNVDMKIDMNGKILKTEIDY